MKLSKHKSVFGFMIMKLDVVKLSLLSLLVAANAAAVALPAIVHNRTNTAVTIAGRNVTASSNCTDGIIYAWQNGRASSSNLTICGGAETCRKLSPELGNYPGATWKAVGMSCILYSGENCRGIGTQLSTGKFLPANGSVTSFECHYGTPALLPGQEFIFSAASGSEQAPNAIWYAWRDVSGRSNVEGFCVEGNPCRNIVPGHTFWDGSWRASEGWTCTVYAGADCSGQPHSLDGSWRSFGGGVTSFACWPSNPRLSSRSLSFTAEACDGPLRVHTKPPNGLWYSWIDSSNRANMEGFCAPPHVCRDVLPGHSFSDGTWRASPGWACTVYSDGHCSGIAHHADQTYRYMPGGVMSFVCWPLSKELAEREDVGASDVSRRENAAASETCDKPLMNNGSKGPDGLWYRWDDITGGHNFEGFCAVPDQCRSIVGDSRISAGEWRASPGWVCTVFSDPNCNGLLYILETLWTAIPTSVSSFSCYPPTISSPPRLSARDGDENGHEPTGSGGVDEKENV